MGVTAGVESLSHLLQHAHNGLSIFFEHVEHVGAPQPLPPNPLAPSQPPPPAPHPP